MSTIEFITSPYVCNLVVLLAQKDVKGQFKMNSPHVYIHSNVILINLDLLVQLVGKNSHIVKSVGVYFTAKPATGQSFLAADGGSSNLNANDIKLIK